MTQPRVIVVMGVAGAGKSLMGKRLAASLGWQFADADDFHPAANVAKMSSGEALTDADRGPWLAALHVLVRDTAQPLVLACSALKASYRKVIEGELTDVRFVFLNGSFADIAERLEQRVGHYMPASLLRSQFDALEPPADALELDCLLPPEELVARVVAELGL